MSEVGRVPPADEPRTGESDGAEHQPEERLGEFFRFRPFRFYRFLTAEIAAQGAAKNKRDYCANAARRIFLASRRSYVVRGVFAVAAIGVVSWFCFQSGYFTPNRTVATFTVVMALIAAVQWATTQGQLRQARHAAKQTDAIIRQMRLDQRPWVHIHNPMMKPPKNGERATSITYDLVNNGKSPTTVGRTLFWTAIVPANMPTIQLAREGLAGTSVHTLGTSPIPPGGSISQTVEYDLAISDQNLKALEEGRAHYVIAGKFIYSEDGVDDGECVTGCLYVARWNENILKSLGGPNDNYMR